MPPKELFPLSSIQLMMRIESSSLLHRIVEDPGMALRKLFVYGTIVAIYAVVIVFSAFTCIGLPVAIISLVLFFIQYYYSDRIMLRATGARVLDRAEAPGLYAMIDEVSGKVGISPPRAALISAGIPNAFATGRGERTAVVAFTSGLLEQLDPGELRAVTAHEMSHIKNRDMFVVVFASFAVSMLSWVVYVLLHSLLSGRRGSVIANIIADFAAWLLSSTIGVVLVNTVSRYREYSADRGSALATGDPDALIRALGKITAAAADSGTGDRRTMDPVKAVLTGSTSRAVTELFSTHPLIEKRIAALEHLRAEIVAAGYLPVKR